MATKNTASPATLPKSGKPYEAREGRGHDLLKAQKMSKGDPNLVSFALIALLVKIEGKAVTLEEVLDLPFPDVAALIGVVGGDMGNAD